MSDFDLDRLGNLWRQDPEPAEIEKLRLTARGVSRRARWAQFGDTAGALVAGAGLLVVCFANRNLQTLIPAGASILFMLISVIRTRKLREIEIRSLTGTTEEMIEQSIERVHATRKRIRFSALGLLAAIPLGAWLVSTHGSGATHTLAAVGAGSRLYAVISAVLAALVLLMLLNAWRIWRQSADELDRFIALRDAYRREQDDSSEG
jgi:hypothetical protein